MQPLVIQCHYQQLVTLENDNKSPCLIHQHLVISLDMQINLYKLVFHSLGNILTMLFFVPIYKL